MSMPDYAAAERADQQRSSLVSRNISVLGHRTSIRLEPEMWQALKDVAKRESCTIHDICSLVAMRKRPQSSLTAAIRVFVMLYFRAASTDDGHRRAGHGSLQQMVVRAGLALRGQTAAVLRQAKKIASGRLAEVCLLASLPIIN